MNIQMKGTKTAAMLLLTILLGSCASAGKNKTDSNNGGFYTTIERSHISSYNGYTYEFWNQNEAGEAVMNLRKDSSFEITWNGIYNMLARNGVRPGEGVTSVSYEVDGYSVTKGVSYLCVYGWTYDVETGNNLVEFYIVDNWMNYRPPGNQGTQMGTVTVDGDIYDIYVSKRVNQPSILGTKTFIQYWSVRRYGAQRTSGTIDVVAHFEAWKNLGMGFGDTMYEVSFCVEGYGGNAGGSGYANISHLSFNTK